MPEIKCKQPTSESRPDPENQEEVARLFLSEISEDEIRLLADDLKKFKEAASQLLKNMEMLPHGQLSFVQGAMLHRELRKFAALSDDLELEGSRVFESIFHSLEEDITWQGFILPAIGAARGWDGQKQWNQKLDQVKAQLERMGEKIRARTRRGKKAPDVKGAKNPVRTKAEIEASGVARGIDEICSVIGCGNTWFNSHKKEIPLRRNPGQKNEADYSALVTFRESLPPRRSRGQGRKKVKKS